MICSVLAMSNYVVWLACKWYIVTFVVECHPYFRQEELKKYCDSKGRLHNLYPSMLSNLENIRFSFLKKRKLNKVVIKTSLLYNNSLLRMLQKGHWLSNSHSDLRVSMGWWLLPLTAMAKMCPSSWFFVEKKREGGGPLVTFLTCEQTHLWVTRASGE